MPKYNRKVEMDADGVYETWTNRNGSEHFGNFFPFDDEDDDAGEYISVYDAAPIYASNGKDDDYTFGYTEGELEGAL